MNMSQETEWQVKLRSYLLGGFEGKEIEKEEIEERLVCDEGYFQLLLSQEEELIEKYVNEELSADEREGFEKYFLIPVERRQKVKLELLLRNHINDEIIPEVPEEHSIQDKLKGFIRLLFSVRAVAAILLIAGAAFLFWNFFIRNSDAGQKALVSLNKAYSAERPFESRISALDYAPYNKTRDQNKIKVSIVDENRAERISLDEVSENPTAENQHLLGRVYLAKREFEKALQLLEEAQKKAPQDPEILSDIGAVYLEKSKIAPKGDEKLVMVANAIENFDKALAIKPDLLPARFNKAVATEVYLTNRAKEAWEEYLKFDQTSGWANEARDHLEALSLQKSQDISSGDLEQAFLAAYEEQNDVKAFQILSQNRELINGKYLPQKLAMTLVNKKKMKEINRSSF